MSRPNKLRAHSSRRFDLLVVEIVMSSSSSLVSRRCCMLSSTVWSIAIRRFESFWGYQRPSWNLCVGGRTRTLVRERNSYKGEFVNK